MAALPVNGLRRNDAKPELLCWYHFKKLITTN
jgi:hypothetical protein